MNIFVFFSEIEKKPYIYMVHHHLVYKYWDMNSNPYQHKVLVFCHQGSRHQNNKNKKRCNLMMSYSSVGSWWVLFFTVTIANENVSHLSHKKIMFTGKTTFKCFIQIVFNQARRLTSPLSDSFPEVIATAERKESLPWVKVLISLGLVIVGNIWNNVSS